MARDTEMDISSGLDKVVFSSVKNLITSLEDMDCSDLGVMVLDSAMRICFWSDWLDEWTGVAANQATGKSLSGLFPGVLGSGFQDAVDSSITQQRETAWSQQLDPEQLDSIERAFTNGGRALPLNRIAFSPVSVSGSDDYCLVELSEAAYEPLRIADLNVVQDDKTPPESVFSQQTDLKFLQTVCEHISDGVFLLNQRGKVEYINPVGCEQLGVSRTIAVGQSMAELMTLTDRFGEEISLPSSSVLGFKGRESTIEHALLSGNGIDFIPVTVTAALIKDNSGQALGSGVIIRPVSESRHLSSRLHWQANHDPLTQLANRRKLETELQNAIDHAQAHNTTHTLLYIDLYNFSVVNDTSGYKAGDELLRQFARMLETLVAPKDVVARIGNDEFALLINDRPVNEARELADSLLWEVKDFSFPWEERRLKVGVSVGAKVIDQDTASEIDVLLAAGSSCRLAKESGRNRIHFQYRSTEVMKRQSIVDWIPKISDALEENRYELCYQPIVAASDTEKVQHHELLVRMIDRQGKRIAPDKFIPAAERYSLIEDIDKWVFDHLLKGLTRQMESNAGDNSRFAVNLSGFTISDETWKDYVIARVRESKIDPGRIQFEITETTAIRHFDRTVRLIRAMKDEGFHFALDDFGNGLSSLGYLKQLPVDYLKIDGSFITAMVNNDVDYSMVSTINHLGQIMGIATIAERVETEQQLEMLKDIGVNFVQGYYVARPKPLDELLDVASLIGR